MNITVDSQIASIEEYMSAAQDYHDALTLLSEAKVRVRNAIEANVMNGISKADPLGIERQIRRTDTADSPVVAVESAMTTSTTKQESGKRTRNSPRSSPGFTKKAVYDSLPGDVDAIAKRTGLSRTRVWSAAADLVGAGLVERHGTRGNTTYTIKGERLKWSQRQFAAVRYTNPIDISS